MLRVRADRPPRPMRFALLLALLASATPALAQSALVRAEARLAAGDSSGAHRLLYSTLRDADDDTPDRAALMRLRLRLELAGIGMGSVPRPFRHQQIVDGATRLLRLAPADTLALRVLVDDAVWTVLQWHDRVRFGDVSSPYGAFISPAEIASRMSTSRFDMDDRAAMGPPLERDGRSRDAARDAARWLDTWRGADPASPAAAQAAATLAVVARDWGGLLALAEAWGAASGDPRADLYAGLAHHHLGDAEAAGVTFDRARRPRPFRGRPPAAAAGRARGLRRRPGGDGRAVLGRDRPAPAHRALRAARRAPRPRRRGGPPVRAERRRVVGAARPRRRH